MKNVVNKINNLDQFLKAQVYVGVLMHFSWGLIIPLVAKWQGVLLSAWLIGIVKGLMDAAPLFAKVVKSKPLGWLYGAGNIFTGLILWGVYLAARGDYFSCIGIEFLGAFSLAVCHSEQKAKMSRYMAKSYEAEMLETYTRMKEARKSIGIITGVIGMSIVDNYFGKEEAIWLALGIGVVVLLVKVYHYFKYFKHLE